MDRNQSANTVSDHIVSHSASSLSFIFDVKIGYFARKFEINYESILTEIFIILIFHESEKISCTIPKMIDEKVI